MRQVNADWMYGRVDSREGMFPTNFVEVNVPLPHNVATALHTFTPETREDLGFPEGAAISVLNRVNGDWLYGEYNGKKGQFPASFVDHVPENLPLHKL
uniref:SH3 domain-containing protein n=1 Tax=Timema cristinae TaxID=61476 RepID=A0A7R9CZ06_TIMCR|nr:unnamed protein product [Timema cristinae]